MAVVPKLFLVITADRIAHKFVSKFIKRVRKRRIYFFYKKNVRV